MRALFANIPEVTPEPDFTWLLPFFLTMEGPGGRASSLDITSAALTGPPDSVINLGHFLFPLAHD